MPKQSKKAELYWVTDVNSKQLVGVFASKDDAVLASENTAAHCEIFVTEAKRV